MRNFKRYILIILMLFSANVVFATTYPEPQGKLVNDFTNTLNATTKDRIEQTLRTFEQKTTNEIAVVIVPDLQGENVDVYAVKLFEKWKIGKKGKDNGLLLLISIKDRKWRFEVGYGLEGVLNDAKCGHIGREFMVPYLKKGDYGKGIEEAILAIIKNIEASKVEAAPVKKVDNTDSQIIFLIILGIIVLGLIVNGIWFFFYRKKEEEIEPEHIPYYIPPIVPIAPVHYTKPEHYTPHETKREEPVRRRHDDDDDFHSSSSSSSSDSGGSSGFDFGGGSSGGGGASGGF